MMRGVLAFVAGWAAMMLVVMAGFVAGPFLLGVERVFEPGRYEATTLWIVAAMGVGLLGGAAGGWVAARVGRGRAPVLAMALVIVAASIAGALGEQPAGDPAPRPPDQGLMEALEAARVHGREPLVTRVTNPLVGLLGLALGAGLALRGGRGRRSRGADEAAR